MGRPSYEPSDLDAGIRALRDRFSDLGLATADSLARPSPAVGKTKRRSALERTVERSLGIAVVALVGEAQRRPRDFGDNEGGQGITAVASADPRLVYMHDDKAVMHGLAAAIDRHHPHGPGVVEFVRAYVASDAHAKRLKAALDTVLVGSMAGARHRWRDVPLSFDLDMLGLLIGEASQVARVVCFDSVERDRRKMVAIQKLARKARGG